jgi:hypothetical protein
MAWKGRRAERTPIERRDLVGPDWPRVTKVAELERAAPRVAARCTSSSVASRNS